MTGGTILRYGLPEHAKTLRLTSISSCSVTIDPNLGGCTHVEGGHPPSILMAGKIAVIVVGTEDLHSSNHRIYRVYLVRGSSHDWWLGYPGG